MFTSRLNVHDKRVLIECFDSRVKSDLDHDFNYFLNKVFDSKAEEHFHLTVLPLNRRPRFWIPLLKTKRSILYASTPAVRRICFFNSAWLEYRFNEKKCTIYCDDPISAYEAVYLVLLSYLGEALGLGGMHRIHGMGFNYKGKGGIVLARSGGGKSTLALELLKSGDFRLISDDTPVLNSNGEMLAFPQRIALSEKPSVDVKFLRRFKRFHHGEKYVVGSEYFANQIAGSSKVDWLILLSEHALAGDSNESGTKEVSRVKVIWPLIKWLVVGYETPQIWELLLRPTREEFKNQTGILVGRLKTAAKLLMKSRVAVVRRGPTPDVTAERLTKSLL